MFIINDHLKLSQIDIRHTGLMYRLSGVLISISLLIGVSYSSQYDPHLYPSRGPFFEGWYIRLVDFSCNRSLGVLFGRVLPGKTNNVVDDTLGLVSILHVGGDGVPKLLSQNARIQPENIDVTVRNGQRVRNNPDFTSPADFTWNASRVGFLKVQPPSSSSFNFTVGSWRFTAVLGAPEPWSNDGLGPEGTLAYLPLPLHWFVYSLHTPVTHYELRNLETNAILSGDRAVAHMEKNWGRSFPKAWIWIQGTTREGITFAATTGVVTFLRYIDVPAHLIGYRNPSKGIQLNFRPIDSLVTLEADGCAGRVRITINSFFYRVDINVTAQMNTFSDCLLGPQPSGFSRSCVESFNAQANIHLQKRWSSTVLDQQVIPLTALEFGGDYVCNKRCTT